MGVCKQLAWLALMPCLAQAATHRFGATIDSDGDPANGCIQATATGELRGEWQTLALTDHSQRLDTRLEVCRNGEWIVVASASEPAALAFGTGESGSDRIEWQAPGAIPSRHPLAVQVWAERIDGSAGDLLDRAGEPLALYLASGLAEAAVPSLGIQSLLLLGAAMLIAGRRRLSMNSAPLAMLAVLALGSPLGAPAVATAPGEPCALGDAANDSADAGADLIYAQIWLDAGRLRLALDVNNLQADRLGDTARVLFIGNSLTYANDLPQMVQAIAAQAGKALHVDAVTFGGGALEDHYGNRATLARIVNGHYDLVVLQQGPSSLPESQEHLAYWTRRFDAPIRASGARPALYMVWPDITRFEFFDAVRFSYSEAALAVNGMFIPAGEAWRAAWRADPTLRLYDADQFHPSGLGTYTAALSMFCEFYGQTPEGLPSRVRVGGEERLRLPDGQALTVQQAAWEAHLEYGRWGG